MLRETLYFAIDLLNRKEAATPDTIIPIVGATCLYIAAKVEEDPPPAIMVLVNLIQSSSTPTPIVPADCQLSTPPLS